VRKIFAVTAWLSLGLVVCGQSVKPLAKLDAPEKLNFAVVCEGGASMVGVAGEHEVFVWSLPSGTQRTIGGMKGRISPSVRRSMQPESAGAWVEPGHGGGIRRRGKRKASNRAEI
jgi:hypothetical protein